MLVPQRRNTTLIWSSLAHTPLKRVGQEFPVGKVTRINCVPVQELSGPHLVAEYRELPRVFALAEKAAARGHFLQPHEYTLGKGHLLFFYTRLAYLAKRHRALVKEMERRGYKPSFPGIQRSDFPNIPDRFWGDWDPCPEALQINRQRIAERTRPKYRAPA